MALRNVRGAVVACNQRFWEEIRKTTNKQKKTLLERPVYRETFEGNLDYEVDVTVTNIKYSYIRHMERNMYSCKIFLELLSVPPFKMQYR
jgi:hypothetical protein